MPRTYQDYLKNFDGFTEEDRKTISDFQMMLTDMQQGLKQNIDDISNNESLSKSFKNKTLEPLYALNDSMMFNSPFKAANDVENLSKTKENAENIYKETRESTERFLYLMNDDNKLFTFLDSSQYLSDKREVKPVETFFKFAELMQKVFAFEILDINKQKNKYTNHRKEKEKLDQEAAEKISYEMGSTYLTRAETNYNNAKLLFRGSDEYDNIGRSFATARANVENTQNLLILLKNGGENLKKETIVAQLNASIKSLDGVLDATEAYYEHKKTDGKNQWHVDPSQIKNKNARARRYAAIDMASFASWYKSIYQNKLEELKAGIDKDSDPEIQDNLSNDNINIIEMPKNEIRISENEDPSFTTAVAEDRKIIQDNLNVVKDNTRIAVHENYSAIRNGLAGIIAANLLRGKMEPDSPDYAKEKSVHQQEIAADLEKLADLTVMGENAFIKFADNAFSTNGAALTREYLKLKAPVKIEDPTKVETVVNKAKTNPTV